MFHHHGLGRAGRAGGVDHVSQPARGGTAVHRRRIRRRRVVGMRIQIELRHAGSPCRRSRPPLQQHFRCAVRQHEAQAILGVVRIERHVTAACLEHAEDPYQHLRAALHADRDAIIRLHAEASQPVRQPVGTGVQLAVAQSPVAEQHRIDVRVAGSALLEQLVDAAIRRQGQLRGVPRFDDQPALGVGHDRQAHDVGALVSQHAGQQLAVVPGDPLRGIATEQGSGTGKPAADLPFGNPHRQHQVAARVRLASVRVVPGRIRQLPHAGAIGFHHEHRLEQRVMRRVSRQAEQLDEPTRRDIAMPRGVEHALGHAAQKFGYARLAREVHPQRKNARSGPARRRRLDSARHRHARPDNDIVLARKTRKQRHPCRQQHGATLVPRRIGTVGRHAAQSKIHHPLFGAQHGRPRVIGLNRQELGSPRENHFPECLLSAGQLVLSSSVDAHLSLLARKMDGKPHATGTGNERHEGARCPTPLCLPPTPGTACGTRDGPQPRLRREPTDAGRHA